MAATENVRPGWVWLSDVPSCYRKHASFPDAGSATALLVREGVPHLVVQGETGRNPGMGVLVFHEPMAIWKLNGIAADVRLFGYAIAYVAPPFSRESCCNAALLGYSARSFLPVGGAQEEKAGLSLESLLAEHGYTVKVL
ncbi:hypothetical protein HYU17_03585 [Candidatus Woesearchaeota archaeon]|nr:hypothetical protein [Candidatus Woesearchaeota archaeon]